MSVHIVTASRAYVVDKDSVVSVRVVIGEAQAGGWVIAWDSDHVIAKGKDERDVAIGPGSELRGRTLQVVATAVDVRPETNRLSSTLILTGGRDGEQRFVSRWDDGSDGDAAVFSTLVELQ